VLLRFSRVFELCEYVLTGPERGALLSFGNTQNCVGGQRRRRRLFLGLGEKASAAAAALGGIKSGWMVRF
jgi:hypothetical protein